MGEKLAKLSSLGRIVCIKSSTQVIDSANSKFSAELDALHQDEKSTAEDFILLGYLNKIYSGDKL